jgi:hypothetical protein
VNTFSSYNFKGQKALVRVDFNVPLNDKFEITDDTRITAAVPTIQKIVKDGGKVILMSHFGRPKDGRTEKFSLNHLVKHLGLYETSFLKAFRLFFGDPGDFCILGLLPSYLEKGSSSLVYMVDQLIKRSGHGDSGFYLHDHEKLTGVLKSLENRGEKTILFGVSYALLDLAASHPMKLNHTTLIETGGMKGRKKEISKQELYDELKQAFSVGHICSEYGMTELLSQAYSKGNGIFYCPSWMKILLREEDDPLLVNNIPLKDGKNKSGIINVIDLANIYSCSFIATDDVGRLYPDGGFEVLGRVDNSDLRGCSLMVL